MGPLCGRARGVGVVSGHLRLTKSDIVDSAESDIRDWCIHYLAKALNLPTARIDPDAKFARLGMDSAASVSFVMELEEWLAIELPTSIVFDFPTITRLSRRVAEYLKNDHVVAPKLG